MVRRLPWVPTVFAHQVSSIHEFAKPAFSPRQAMRGLREFHRAKSDLCRSIGLVAATPADRTNEAQSAIIHCGQTQM